MNVPTALKQKDLTNLMSRYANHGATDSEGWQAMREIEAAADEGKRFPFTTRRNPFQLYESVSGWEQASAELVNAAEIYWKALVEEKLGITIA